MRRGNTNEMIDRMRLGGGGGGGGGDLKVL